MGTSVSSSIYYDGPVTETDRAQNLAGAAEYGVYGPDDFKVTAHPSIPYAVLVKAGRAHGHGVTDILTQDAVVQCATLAAGQIRWDMIVVRRNWQPALGGPSTLEYVQAGALPQIPGTRKVGPGVEDDQPLFFVKWQGGTTAPVEFVDARVWAGNGGLYAKSDIVRTYLGRVGTEVNINGAVWSYRLGVNDLPVWVNDAPRIDAAQGAAQPVIKAFEGYAVTTQYSTGRFTFDPPFPSACSAATITSSTGALTAVTFRILDRKPTYVEFAAYNAAGQGLPTSGIYANVVAAGY